MATLSPESKPFHHFQDSLPRPRSLKGKHNNRKRLAIELVPDSFRKVAGVREEVVKNGNIPVRLVEVDLDGKPLGFHVERRLNENVVGARRWQVLISGLEEGSAVHSHGLLCEGDEVISINGTCVSEICSQQEIGLLLQVSDCLSIAIASKSARSSPDNDAQTPPGSNTNLDCGRSSPETQSPEVPLSPDTPTRSPATASRQFRAVRSKSLTSTTAPLSCAKAADDLIGTAKSTASLDWPRTPTKVKTGEPNWSKTLPLHSSIRKLTTGQPDRSNTRMLQLAEIFVPESGDHGEECISLPERRELFAKCLAEEFDLPFLANPHPEPMYVRL